MSCKVLHFELQWEKINEGVLSSGSATGPSMITNLFFLLTRRLLQVRCLTADESVASPPLSRSARRLRHSFYVVPGCYQAPRSSSGPLDRIVVY